MQFSALATESVTLAWDTSTDPIVAGYNVYYGGASGAYTNEICAGNATNATISGLVEGTTYYFAATTYAASGMESPFSSEVSYLVPTNPIANQPPTLNAINSLAINENAGLQTVNLSGIGSGAPNESQTLTVTATSSNAGLIPNPTVIYTSANSTGSLTFTPVANGNGTATITVTVNDGGTSNNIVTRTFTVTVNGANQPPTLNAISNLAINENAGLQTVGLSGIGSGAPNESQTLTVTATSSNAGLIPNPTVIYTSANSTGSLTFTPAVNGNGTATITVTVNDGGTSNNIVTQTFTVTVNAVNQTPTLNAIGNLTINENAGLQTVSLSGIGSGATNENQTLTVTAVSSNTGLIPNPTVVYTSANSTGSLTFTPAVNGNGTATITVTVNDGGTSNNIVTQTFTVTVNAVNQTPTLNAIGNLAINENAGLQTVGLSGIGSGAANENQTLTVTAVSSNTGLIPNPTVVYTSANSTGSLTFTPVANGNGTATITVTVNDGGTSNNIVTRTFTVTVNGANQPPTLNAIGNLAINENAGLQTVGLSGIGSGAANENQTLTVTAVSSNTGLIPNPTVIYTSANSTGSLTFTPVANGNGTATITVTVNDGGTSNNIVTRTFTVTVNGANQPPTLNAIGNLAINENAGLQTVGLSGIGSGAANENQTLTVTAVSSNTGLIPNPTVVYTSANSTGSLTFTPVANGNGTATITVTVNDGGATNNIVTRTFMVTVNAVNQPPTLNAITNLTIGKNAGRQTVSLSGISSGATNESQTLTVTATSSNTGLIPNPTVVYTSANSTGSLTFTPVANGNGTATITVTVNDGGATNNIVTRTFMVTVNAVNQPPTLNAITNLTIGKNAGRQTVSLSGISSGATNENQTLTVTAVSSNTGLIPNPTVVYTSANTTGILTFTPVVNKTGTATITVTVKDGGNSNNIVTRTFTVNIGGTAPTRTAPTRTAPARTTTARTTTTRTTTARTSSLCPTLGSQLTNQVAVIGQTSTFTIGASGSGTLKYQWKYNGTNLPASVGSVLTLNNVTVNQSGAYSVTVSDSNGSNSSTALLTVYDTAAATLVSAAHAGGQYALIVEGVPGYQYVVQASTNMVNWVPVQTNTAPFTFVDANASHFSQRFYRSVYTPANLTE